MALNIYFGGSITGGRGDADLYRQIIKVLQNYGTVLTEQVGASLEEIETELKSSPKFIHDRELASLEKCHVLVAEVTQPSLGVGYELGRALEKEKPVLCLFRPYPGKHLSSMIAGADNGETFIVKEYTGTQYEDIIRKYFESFKRN